MKKPHKKNPKEHLSPEIGSYLLAQLISTLLLSVIEKALTKEKLTDAQRAQAWEFADTAFKHAITRLAQRIPKA